MSGERGHGWRFDVNDWSIGLGSVAGIHIRVNLLLLFFIAGRLIFGLRDGTFLLELTLCGMMTVLVLLHEFGHCFGCRWVGGHADRIMLWPLGGLANCEPPRRPFEHFVTAAAGPAVNLLILILLLPPLIYYEAVSIALWNPFDAGYFWQPDRAIFYVALAWKVNYWLFLFNVCLPMFPMDAGRFLQCAAWPSMGYFEATMLACRVGMALAVVVGAGSLYLMGKFSNEYFLLLLVALFCFTECSRQRLELIEHTADGNEFGYDFSEGYTSLERSMNTQDRKLARPSLWTRLRDHFKAKEKARAERIEVELDRILEKITATGVQSLSRAEKKILGEASRRRRRP